MSPHMSPSADSPARPPPLLPHHGAGALEARGLQALDLAAGVAWLESRALPCGGWEHRGGAEAAANSSHTQAGMHRLMRVWPTALDTHHKTWSC